MDLGGDDPFLPPSPLEFPLSTHSPMPTGCSSEGELKEEVTGLKGRLDAFGNELKLILAEVTILTGWIQKHFGIQLINQDSLLFKHIYDLEEIEEIALGMAFPSPPPVQSKGRRGRPRKIPPTPVPTLPPNATPTHDQEQKAEELEQMLGVNSSISQDHELEWNPQEEADYVVSDLLDDDGEWRGRPRRITRRRVNYEEGEESQLQPPLEAEVEPVIPGEEEELVKGGDTGGVEEAEAETKGRKRGRRKKGADGRSRTDGWESKGPKQCDECGKVVQGTSSLKKHKMMHADERPYPCPECGKTFRDKKNVKIHLIALHNGERHLQCSFCGRKFYAPKDLRIHERTHTGDKPHPCHLCPKRFNVKEHLTMHIRVHTGERPYPCPTCGKAFSQANSLRIHKKIHLREKEPQPRKQRKPKEFPLPLLPRASVDLHEPAPQSAELDLIDPTPGTTSPWRTPLDPSGFGDTVRDMSIRHSHAQAHGDFPPSHTHALDSTRYFYM